MQQVFYNIHCQEIELFPVFSAEGTITNCTFIDRFGDTPICYFVKSRITNEWHFETESGALVTPSLVVDLYERLLHFLSCQEKQGKQNGKT